MKRTHRHRAALLGILAVLSAAPLALMFAPAAHAINLPPQPFCTGAGCNGFDPVKTGCSADAYTPTGASIRSEGGILELRYSPSCHANWARWTSVDFGDGPAFYLEVGNTSGDVESFYHLANIGQYTETDWTPMVNGYPKAVAFDDQNSTGLF